MNIFTLMKSDVCAKAEWSYGGVSCGKVLKCLLTDGTFAMLCYRLMQWSQKWHLIPLAMLFNKINAMFAQCIIGRNARFGPGFVLVHSQGVVINSAVCGGANVKIEHQVTIGAEKQSAPVLGDNVFIGAGAKIIGPVSIGNDVKIGANAVVTKDTEPYSINAGIPAKKIGERK